MTGRWLLLTAAAGVAALAAPAELSAQAARPLFFCAAADNLPMSGAYPPAGVEVEVAQRVAARLGREAVLRWVDLEESPETVMLQGRCDVALGAVTPDAMARERMTPGIALTEPYYGTGYVVVRRADAPPVRALDDLGDTRIGVEVESVPIYTLKQRGRRVYALDDYDAVIRAVADGRIRYGYLWGPLASWLLRDRGDVVVEREFQPVEHWAFALAVREEERALREQLNGAIRSLAADGAIAEIFRRHGVPYVEPAAGEGVNGGG